MRYLGFVLILLSGLLFGCAAELFVIQRVNLFSKTAEFFKALAGEVSRYHTAYLPLCSAYSTREDAPEYLAAVSDDMENGEAFRDAFCKQFSSRARTLMLDAQAQQLVIYVKQLGSSCAKTESELLVRAAEEAQSTADKLSEKEMAETHMPIKIAALVSAMLCIMLF